MSSTKTTNLTTTIGLAVLVAAGCSSVASQAKDQDKLGTFRQRRANAGGAASPKGALPSEVPGELVVRIGKGVDARAVAASVGGEVKRKLHYAPNTYVIQGVEGSLEQAAAFLNARGARATRNQIFRPQALPPVTPNDPLYPRQWALRSIGAANTWGITVGQRLVNGPKDNEVVVALLDSGIDTTHPDLIDTVDQVNGYDAIQDLPYDSASGVTDTHGTSVAGCIAPETNNSQGVAGLPWEGVKILPVRVLNAYNDLGTGGPVSAMLDGIYYSIDQGVDVINLSSTLQAPDALITEALISAYDQGIVTVASVGNIVGQEAEDVEYPATLDEVIAVSAVGPSGEPSEYSNSGAEVDLAAPGGNSSGFDDLDRALILPVPQGFSIGFDLPDGYGYDDGTSFAAGYVSGAIATLITQGAGEDLTGPAKVEYFRTLLQSTARNPFGQPTNELGAGILDVDRALRQITQYVDVFGPTPNGTTASFGEPLDARIVLPGAVGLTDDLFDVYQNGELVDDAEVQILDGLSGTILYEPDSDHSYVTGVNTLNVETSHPTLDESLNRSLEGPAVTSTGVNIPARALRFRVTPRIEYPGLKLWSIPYELTAGSDSLEFLLGGSAGRLARWLPLQNRYAIYDPFGGQLEDEASLTTTDGNVVAPPVGLGFWLRVLPQDGPPGDPENPNPNPNAQGVRLNVFGRQEARPFYNIPLKRGFNLIGNPYAFRVPFNLVNVRYGNEVMSGTEAARRKLINGGVFRYQDGRYRYYALPSGELVDWEGHWVQSFQDVTLVVPRVGGSS